MHMVQGQSWSWRSANGESTFWLITINGGRGVQVLASVLNRGKKRNWVLTTAMVSAADAVASACCLRLLMAAGEGSRCGVHPSQIKAFRCTQYSQYP